MNQWNETLVVKVFRRNNNNNYPFQDLIIPKKYIFHFIQVVISLEIKSS